MKKYRASKATAEDKAVNNTYKKRYRASQCVPEDLQSKAKKQY